MIVKTYTASRGYSDEEANVIGVFLDKKFGDNPRTPRQVVAVAKAKSSPLHGFFEWDDKLAADAHRIDQARYMLRSIEVVYTNGEEKPPTRAYHNVVVQIDEEHAETAYVPSRIVWESSDYSGQVLLKAKRELNSWVERFREYQELASHTAIVEAVAESIAA